MSAPLTPCLAESFNGPQLSLLRTQLSLWYRGPGYKNLDRGVGGPRTFRDPIRLSWAKEV